MTGVYTSIADLVHKGLMWRDGSHGTLRLSLVKPDTFDSPLRKWDNVAGAAIESDLQEFVSSGEISIEEAKMLAEGLDGFLSAKA